MQGVRGGYGGCINGRAYDDTKWAIGIVEMELDNLSHRGITAEVPHSLPGQWRSVELPSGGMPGTSGNEDNDAGQFSALSCSGHRGHFVGGKPPSPTVPPLQHYVPLV